MVADWFGLKLKVVIRRRGDMPHFLGRNYNPDVFLGVPDSSGNLERLMQSLFTIKKQVMPEQFDSYMVGKLRSLEMNDANSPAQAAVIRAGKRVFKYDDSKPLQLGQMTGYCIKEAWALGFNKKEDMYPNRNTNNWMLEVPTADYVNIREYIDYWNRVETRDQFYRGIIFTPQLTMHITSSNSIDEKNPGFEPNVGKNPPAKVNININGDLRVVSDALKDHHRVVKSNRNKINQALIKGDNTSLRQNKSGVGPGSPRRPPERKTREHKTYSD